MRRQWARAEENKLRLTARMSGLEESEVRGEVRPVYFYRLLVLSLFFRQVTATTSVFPQVVGVECFYFWVMGVI